jgi:hypothetical protein
VIMVQSEWIMSHEGEITRDRTEWEGISTLVLINILVMSLVFSV